MKAIKNIILRKNGKEKLGTKHYTDSESMLNHLRERYENAGYIVKSYRCKTTNNNILELSNISFEKARSI